MSLLLKEDGLKLLKEDAFGILLEVLAPSPRLFVVREFISFARGNAGNRPLAFNRPIV